MFQIKFIVSTKLCGSYSITPRVHNYPLCLYHPRLPVSALFYTQITTGPLCTGVKTAREVKCLDVIKETMGHAAMACHTADISEER